ncbi:YadA-like family protein [Paraburkholderia bryophila]|uniref:beta strand repeat-containing protein n=1 Tax=Paraburkholderia bryophila TaxID=420952 RepID=UPI00234B76FE|nr:YadA-like family protein [Paraburkholderia bryophila]WCM19293.1 YadA-like family protein [Paraburkholderia bryophila]
MLDGITDLTGHKVVNLARGTADTDAVNVSQLKGVTSALGGGSAVNADGTIKAPTYTVQGQTANDVGTALSKIDGATTKNTGDITTINTNINNLQKDSLQWDTAAGSFSAKHGTSATNKIANVAAGTAATDAVNFGQLTAASASEAAALGGGSTVNADGTITKPKYKVDGKDAVGVDGAVAALDGRVDGVAGDVTNITNNINNGTVGLVQQASKGAKLTVGKDTDGSVVDFLGTAGARQLTNVAKGAVNATSVDAINGSQLYSTAQSAADAFGGGATVDANGKVTKPKYSIGGTDYNNVGDALSAVQSTASGTDAMAVKYDTAAKTKITLAGDGGTTLSNVAAGKANTDAVNVQQLKDAGIIDGNGNSVKAVLFNGPNGEANVAGKKIVNVAAGTSATDGVNFGQLTAASASEAAALGGGSTVNADGTITKPKYKVDGKDAVGVDGAVAALDGRIDGVAGDVTNITNNINNGTVGLVQQASKGAKLTVGKDTDGSVVDFLGTAGARQLTNVAKGAVNATSVDAINGSQLYGTAQSTAAALGGGSAVNADGTIKAPTYTVQGQTATDVGTALSKIDGATTKNTGDITTINNNINNLQKDSLQWDTAAGSFSAKHGTSATNKISNVAAGTAATDAVNFGQLTAASASEAAALGGGSTVNADGTITKPKYKVDGKDAVGVDGAVAALDGRIDGVAGDVTNITNNINNGTIGLVQQASKGAKLTVGKDTDGSVVDFLGTAGARQLTNVAAGAVNATSVDAINGSQLFSTAQSTADAFGGGSTVDANGKVTKPKYNIGGTDYNNVGDALSAVQTTAAGTDAMAVKYDTAAKTAITLAGDGGTTLSNVAAGKADTDAVNVQQLKDAGIIDGNGNSVKAVLFDGPNGEANVAGKKIVNVAAGTAATDAVNFGQLTAASASEAAALGGGSTVNADGTITLPQYKLDGGSTTADNVGDAITNLDGRTTDNSSAITNITNNINNGTIGMVQQASKGAKLTVGKDTDGTEVNFTGTAGDRMLTGVAAGTVDNAAVNLAQLKGAIDGLGGGASVDPTTGAVTGPTYNVTNIDGTTTEVHNVGDAITTIDGRVTNIDGRVTNVEGDITNIMNGTSGMVQQAAAGEKLTVGKDTDGKVVDFTGTAGERQLTGVAAGAVNATSVDAINGGQLYGVSQSVADAMGGGATVNPDGTISAPSYVVDGTTVNNVGDAITNIDGRVTQNTGDINTINNTLNNITNGGGITYFHANSTLADSQALGMESVAIGGNAQSRAANSVALGSNSVADRANSVSVGSAGNERQITNVAAGTADTDAVNVAQLKASGIINPDGTTNTAVTYDKNADGSTNYNSVTMGDGVDGGTTIHNVAAGTAGNDAVNVNQMNEAISSVTNMAQAANNPMFAADGNRDTEGAIASGSHATAMGANANASAANSVALGANSVADRENTVSVGSAGNERQIANVAAGTATTDAVNVGQMNESIGAAVGNLPAGMTAKDYTDQQFNAVQSGVNQVARGAYSGVAAATALSMIPDVDLGKTIAVGVGTANYKGYQATAIGASVRITQNLKAKLGAGISAAGTTVGVGASYQW